MKKYNANYAITVMALASVFGFTSCQDDSADMMQNGKSEEQAKGMVGANDSVFVNNKQFQYDNVGVKSLKYVVGDIDYGPATPRLATRAGGICNPSVDLLNQVSSALASVGSEGSVVMQLMEKNADMMSEIDAMCAKQQDVIRMMDQLQKNCNDAEMDRIYGDYMKKFLCMKSFNCSTFNSYYKALSMNNKAMADYVLEGWLKHIVNGGTAPMAALEYLNEIIRPMGGHKATDVYDYWVFQTTPWEHEGYQKREQLRLNDVCTGVVGYLLAREYFVKKDMPIAMLNDAFSKFANYYMNNSDVVRHDDLLICQIEGAHIVFHKDLSLRDMKEHPWNRDNKTWDTVNYFMYGDCNMKTESVMNNMLSLSEAKAIYNFYNADRAEGERLTFEQIMKQVGFDCGILTDGMRHVMPLNDGCKREREGFFSSKWHMIYNHAVVANEDKAFNDNFEIGVLLIDKCGSYVEIEGIRGWHRFYDECQYFRPNIVKRFKGWEV